MNGAGERRTLFQAGRADGSAKPDGPPGVPIPAIILAALGAMLLFMGGFFGLVACLGVGGFVYPSVIVLALGGLMVAIGYRSWTGVRNRHEETVEKERDRLICDYCGGQNAEGEQRCEFCGAPLR